MEVCLYGVCKPEKKNLHNAQHFILFFIHMVVATVGGARQWSLPLKKKTKNKKHILIPYPLFVRLWFKKTTRISVIFRLDLKLRPLQPCSSCTATIGF